MDVGCGTGLSGTFLKEQGFIPTHGCDGSQGMLDQVPDGVYKHKLRIFFGSDPSLQEYIGAFDLVIGAGCFGYKHIPDTAMAEIISYLKKGGLLAFDIRGQFYDLEDGSNFENCKYKELIENLIKENKIKLIKQKEVEKGLKRGQEAGT